MQPVRRTSTFLPDASAAFTSASRSLSAPWLAHARSMQTFTS